MAHWIKLPTLSLLVAFATTLNAFASLDPRPPIDEAVAPNDKITLTFTAPVAIERTTIQLSGPRGPVRVGQFYTGTDPSELVVPVSNNLPAGVYFIRFDAYSMSGERFNGTSSVAIPDRSLPQAIGYGSADGKLGTH